MILKTEFDCISPTETEYFIAQFDCHITFAYVLLNLFFILLYFIFRIRIPRQKISFPFAVILKPKKAVKMRR